MGPISYKPPKGGTTNSWNPIKGSLEFDGRFLIFFEKARGINSSDFHPFAWNTACEARFELSAGIRAHAYSTLRKSRYEKPFKSRQARYPILRITPQAASSDPGPPTYSMYFQHLFLLHQVVHSHTFPIHLGTGREFP